MNNQVKQVLFFLITGVLAVGMGIFCLITDYEDEQNCTVSVTATVVDYKVDEDYNSSTEMYSIEYYPIVTYEVDGKTIQSQYSQYYNDRVYEIGEEIGIKYDPNQPDSFVVSGERRGLGAAMWEIPLGVILLGVAIFKVVCYLKMRPKETGFNT